MIKIAVSKDGKRLTMSRTFWKFLGLKTGWLQSRILTSSAQGLHKSAAEAPAAETQAANGIPGSFDEQALSNAIAFKQGDDATLRVNNVAVDDSEAQAIVHDAFFQLYRVSPKFRTAVDPYIAADRKFRLGTSFVFHPSKPHLVPTMNGIAMNELQGEFTGLIRARIDKPSERHVYAPAQQYAARTPTNADQIVRMLNAAGFIARNGSGWIKSVGAQHGNWETVYHLHVTGAEVATLMNAIRWFSDITNEESSNYVISPKKKTFELTKRSEVSGVMANLGLGEELKELADKIRDHEEKFDLRRVVNQKGKVPGDWHAQTMVVHIDMKPYANKILTNMTERVRSSQEMMQRLAAAQVKNENINAMLETAFSEGFDQGRLIDDEDATALIQMGQAS